MATALFAVIAVVSFTMHGTPRQIVGVQIADMLLAVLLVPSANVWQVRLVFIFCAGVAAVIAAGGRAFLHARRERTHAGSNVLPLRNDLVLTKI